MAVVGIDLGTTYSAIATLDRHQRPVMIPNRDGQPITPSVVYVDENDRVLVGESAKELQGLKEVAAYFKRFMGHSGYRLPMGAKSYDPVALSALVLRQLKQEAELHLGEAVAAAVITVPAYFDHAQRQATIHAGEQAGLKVLQTLNEPTAAAIAYGLDASRQGTVLVYDLGGGTFDVTLLRIDGASLEVLATDGDHHLGGKDWDDRLVRYVADQFESEFGLQPLQDIETAYDLLVRAEALKQQLSQRESAALTLNYAGERGRYEISRAVFESLTQDLMEQTRVLTQTTLDAAGLDWAELQGVLLVGGSTRMPMVADYVRRLSGKAPLTGINVDQAVALGAALQAARLSAPQTLLTLGARRIEDVTSHSLGIVAVSDDGSRYLNSVILKKNRKIPCADTRPYTLNTRRGGEMEVYMLQGELENPLACSVSGRYVLSGIEPATGQAAVIDVTYAYDANNLIQVSGRQRETGRQLSVRSEPLPEDMSWLGRAPAESSGAVHLSVAIALDLSGSMAGDPLAEAQAACRKFLTQFDLAGSSLALLAFADKVNIQQALTQDGPTLEQAIQRLRIGQVGICNMSDPFGELLALLAEREDPRYAIVLTDGRWSYQKRAIARAAACKAAGIEIIAIGFGDADEAFLKAIASSDKDALFTSLDKLGSSFSRIAQELNETHASAPGLRWRP